LCSNFKNSLPSMFISIFINFNIFLINILNICCNQTINYLLKSRSYTFSMNYFVVIIPWITQPININWINMILFNLIIYPVTIFWWSLVIQNLIWHFLIWSNSHIRWIFLFSFNFYKYFWTYLIFFFLCLISQINNIFFEICFARKNINKSVLFWWILEIILIKKFKDDTLVTCELNPFSSKLLFVFPGPV
jgi:hypothetical protein